MFTLKNFPQDKRCVVIEDRIGLPALTRLLKWPQNMIGPVLHPTFFTLDVIEALLMDGCKKVYALNPENYSERVLLSKENFKVPYIQLFSKDEEALEDEEEVEETGEVVDELTPDVDIVTETLPEGGVEVVTLVEATDEPQILNEVPTPIEVLKETVEEVVEVETPVVEEVVEAPEVEDDEEATEDEEEVETDGPAIIARPNIQRPKKKHK